MEAWFLNISGLRRRSRSNRRESESQLPPAPSRPPPKKPSPPLPQESIQIKSSRSRRPPPPPAPCPPPKPKPCAPKSSPPPPPAPCPPPKPKPCPPKSSPPPPPAPCPPPKPKPCPPPPPAPCSPPPPAPCSPPPPATQSNSAATAPPSQSNRPNDGISDEIEIGKVGHVIGLGGFSASVTLMINTPSSAAIHHTLYIVYYAVVCLGITTSISLSFISIFFKGGPRVVWMQKMLIYFTLFIVVFMCFLRLPFMFSLADIAIVMMLMMIGLVFILLCLLVGSLNQHVNNPQNVGDPEPNAEV